MPPHNDPAPDANLSKAISRRHIIEGLGALAATVACSGGEATDHNTPSSGGAGGSGGSGVAGSAAGKASAGAAGATGPAGAGTGGASASGGSGGATGAAAGATGTGSGGQAAGAGGTGTAGTGPAGGTGAGGQASGGVAGSSTAGSSSAGAGPAGAGGGGTGGLPSPTWDDVPLTAMCTKTSATDAAGQGPFFIHELEKGDDISLVRQDIRGRYNESALPGVEMHLHLRLLDYTDTGCEDKPLEGVDVYVWHTDAQGYYSGFGTRGGDDEQKPDVPYAGKPGSGDLDNTDRFLRGVQTTDANGVVSFRSIFPGWYNGRALHIHFVAFKSGSTAASSRVEYNDSNSGNKWLFTTQFYFDTAFSKSIHEKNDPYKARTSIAQYATALAANENGNSKLHFTASLAGDTDGVGGIVTAQMQLLLNPKT